jgi:hypothetical protein
MSRIFSFKFFYHHLSRNQYLPLLACARLRPDSAGDPQSMLRPLVPWRLSVAPALPSPQGTPYLDALKHMLKSPGDDASLAWRVRQALHGEGLPAACLAVCKDGAIVALSDALCGRKPKSGNQVNKWAVWLPNL